MLVVFTLNQRCFARRASSIFDRQVHLDNVASIYLNLQWKHNLRLVYDRFMVNYTGQTSELTMQY